MEGRVGIISRPSTRPSQSAMRSTCARVSDEESDESRQMRERSFLSFENLILQMRPHQLARRRDDGRLHAEGLLGGARTNPCKTTVAERCWGQCVRPVNEQ